MLSVHVHAGAAAVRRRRRPTRARRDARDPRRPSLHRGRRRSRRRRRSSSPRPTRTAPRTRATSSAPADRSRCTSAATRRPAFTTGRLERHRRSLSARSSRAGLHRPGAGGAGRLLGRDPSRPDAPSRSPGSAATRSTCAAPSRRRGRRRVRRRRSASRSSTARSADGLARRARSDVAGRGRDRRRSSAARSCDSATGSPAARSAGQVAALAFDTPRGVAAIRSPDVHDSRRASDADLGAAARGRRPGGADERWQRSVYVDTTTQERTVVLRRLDAGGRRRTRVAPPLDGIRTHPVRRRRDEHEAGRRRARSGSGRRRCETVSATVELPTRDRLGSDRQQHVQPRRRRRGCSAPRPRASARSSRRRRARRRR